MHLFTIKRRLRVEFKLSFNVLTDTQSSGDVLMHIGNKQIKPRGGKIMKFSRFIHLTCYIKKHFVMFCYASYRILFKEA